MAENGSFHWQKISVKTDQKIDSDGCSKWMSSQRPQWLESSRYIYISYVAMVTADWYIAYPPHQYST